MENKLQYTYCKDIINPSRIKTKEICIGNTSMGGENPVRVQTMTNTKTTDIKKSVEQIKRSIRAGAEYVRLSIPSIKDIQAFQDIKQELENQDISVPLIADVHFNRTIAYEMLSIADKVRINPGNFIIRNTDSQESNNNLDSLQTNLEPFLNECKKQNKAIRIGVNHGSLDKHIIQKYGDTPLGMAESAWEYIQLCRRNDFHQIVISIKASNTKIMVHAVRLLVHKMLTNDACYPLHLGVTEAGNETEGRIKSAIGIGSLLNDGIGDTIRVSLTEDPEFEIPVAKKIIAHMQQKHALPNTLDNFFYNPYEYNKNKTTKLQNFGGDVPPQVIINVDSRSGEKNMDPFDFGYMKENGEWIKTNHAADCLFIHSALNLNNLPDQLKILIEYKNFIEYKQKPKNLFPVYSVSEFLGRENLHPNTGFVKLSMNTMNKEVLEKLSQQTIGVLMETKTTNRIGEFRYMFSLLHKFNVKSPVILSASYQISNMEQFIVSSSIDLGSLLIDGFGDGIMISNPLFNDSTKMTDLHFNILQASGARIFKTEYISCPGCARTLFDLQKTTQLIKEKTSHLKGVKIAIMGCIVNGPGEMADADYGYIGSGNGNVNLYKGKILMKKNIDEENAVNELLMLIENKI